MKKAYICSPFRAATDSEQERNIDYAKKLTLKALRDGFIPITPHLYLTQCLNEEDLYERQMGLDAGLALLEDCDVMYVGLAYGMSEGMCSEVKKAQTIGIDIVKY